MNFRLLSIAAFCLVLALSCDLRSSDKLVGVEPEDIPSNGIRNGEQKIYAASGKLESIVQVKNGKADGRVRKYYDNGKLRMEAIYKDGKKNGKCIYYYGNGIAFTVSEYVNGFKEGEEKKYYEDGKLMAILRYKQGEEQPGLKEFRKDGTPLDYKHSIIIQEIDRTSLEGMVVLRVQLSDASVQPKFYVVYPDNPGRRVIMKMSGSAGVLEVHGIPGNFLMQKLIFEAEYKTIRGNRMILRKSYNLAVDF